MLKNKQLNFKFIYILILTQFLSCETKYNQKDFFCSNFNISNKSLFDSLKIHMPDLKDSCSYIMIVDRSFELSTIRINVMPIKSTSIMDSNLQYTSINQNTVYIQTAINEINALQTKDYIHCDEGNSFVLYDSLGKIFIYKDRNDFDDDLRPSQQLKLSLY